jgi:methionine-rich copper-binding protein CopC
VVTVAAVLAGLLVWRAAVFAHAAYDHSTPGESAVIAAAPERVEIWFNGPLVPDKPNRITVNGPDKKDVAEGTVEIGGKDNMMASVRLKPDLPDGRYTVTWKVYALDGMRAEGSYRFYVNVQPTDAELAEDRQLRVDEHSQITTPEQDSGEGMDTGVIAILAGIGGAALVVVAGGGFLLWRYYSEA